VLFDGTVTGTWMTRGLPGILRATRFLIPGSGFDSLGADVKRIGGEPGLRNTVLVRGLLARAIRTGGGSEPSGRPPHGSLIFGRNHPRRPANRPRGARRRWSTPSRDPQWLPGQLTGTSGNRWSTPNIDVAKGAIRNEPFDRLTAQRQLPAAAAWGWPRGTLFGRQTGPVERHLRPRPDRFDAAALRFRVSMQRHAAGAVSIRCKGPPVASPERSKWPPMETSSSGSRVSASPVSTPMIGSPACNGPREPPATSTHRQFEGRAAERTWTPASPTPPSGAMASGAWKAIYPGSATIAFQSGTRPNAVWMSPSAASAASRFAGLGEGSSHRRPALTPQ